MKKIVLSSMIIGSALFADGAAEMLKEAAISKAKTEVTKVIAENVSSENIAKATAVKSAAEDVSSESNLTDKVIDAVKEKAKTKAMDMAKDKLIEH